MNDLAKRFRVKITSMFYKRGMDFYIKKTPVKMNTVGRTLINLGAGDWECEGWTNLDYSSKWYSDVQKQHKFKEYDIRSDDIPYGDGKVDCIYCSHVIEHIEDQFDERMMRECHRVLKSGGILRIACPDAEFLWNMAKNGKDWWVWRKYWCSVFKVDWNKCSAADLLVREIATPRMKDFGYIYGTEKDYMDYEKEFEKRNMNDFFRYITKDLKFNSDHVGDHINYWTYDKLYNALEAAGFKTIIKSKYAGSISPYMKSRSYFDTTEPQMSLYVEAIK